MLEETDKLSESDESLAVHDKKKISAILRRCHTIYIYHNKKFKCYEEMYTWKAITNAKAIVNVYCFLVSAIPIHCWKCEAFYFGCLWFLFYFVSRKNFDWVSIYFYQYQCTNEYELIYVTLHSCVDSFTSAHSFGMLLVTSTHLIYGVQNAVCDYLLWEG